MNQRLRERRFVFFEEQLRSYRDAATRAPRADADVVAERRRNRAITALSPTPSPTRRALPRAQITHTATDSPPAKDGAQANALCTAGMAADTVSARSAASSGGTQGASHCGMRRASITPEPPARKPALDSAQAPIEPNAQAANDQTAKRLSTINQLRAWNNFFLEGEGRCDSAVTGNSNKPAFTIAKLRFLRTRSPC